MDGIGKVNRSGPGRKIDDVALRREDENFVSEHIDLHVMEEIGCIGFLLAFKQPADPCKLVLFTFMNTRCAITQFVFPVCRYAVFRCGMHIPGADLHFKRDTLRPDYRCVYTLVHVGFRSGNIVFKPARYRFEHIMDNAEHVVTVGNRIDDDAESTQVENTAHIDFLGVHFTVNAVNVFDSPVDRGFAAFLLQPVGHFFLHGRHELFQLCHLAFQILHDLVITFRIKILEREIFQLPFCLLHTEPVSERSVDLHRLKGLGALFIGRLIVHGAHVVQAVGNFNEDDTDILRHSHQHLAQIFALLILFAGVLHPRQFGYAFHNISNLGAEFFCNVRMGEGSVFNNIMQESRYDGILIQAHVKADICCRDTVRHIGGSVFSLLAGMSITCHFIGRTNPVQIHAVRTCTDFFKQSFKLKVRICNFLILHLCSIIGHWFLLY